MVYNISDRRSTWLIYFLAIAIIATVFFVDVRHLLVGVDDDITFRNHVKISEDFSYLFSSEKELASGRVVDELILWLGHILWGENLALFHLLIALVHALASFSLALCCRQMGADMASSLGTGILFLTNIAHVGTVHWISALEYPLALLISTWTLYLYSSFTKTPKKLFLYLFYFLAIICVLTHFITILLWPLCWYYAHTKSVSHRGIARHLFPVLPLLLFALFAAFSMMGDNNTTHSALLYQRNAIESGAGIASMLSDSFQLFVWYLGRLLFMAHWLPSNPGVEHPLEMAIGILTLAILVYLIWKENDAQWWSIWTLAFTVSFVPAALVHTGASHHIYLATAGSSFLLSWVIVRTSEYLGHYRQYIIALVLSILLTCSYSAENRAANLSLYQSGHYYINQNKADLGLVLLRQSIERDEGLISLEEASIYQLYGLFKTGQDYEEVLFDALNTYPENEIIRLIYAISELTKNNEQTMTVSEALNALYENFFLIEEEAFLHTVDVISQLLGYWFYQNSSLASAANSFQFSLLANPYDSKSAVGLMIALVEGHRYEEAANSANEMLIYHGDNVRFLVAAAFSYRKTNQLKKAAEMWERIALLQPHSFEPQTQLVDIYRETEEFEKGIQLLESAQKLHSLNPSLFYSLGNLYEDIGRIEDAVSAYTRAVELGADGVNAHFKLGAIFFSANRLGDAEQIYQQALRIDPKESAIYQSMGKVAMAKKDTVAALFNLALYHVALGDSLSATRIYQQAISTFGVEEAHRTGAVDNLHAMLETPQSAFIARQLLKAIPFDKASAGR